MEVSEATGWVSDDAAGAISLFVGTTRDHFDGKKVVRLEYEAYKPMALKEMRALVERARATWDIKKMLVWHRLGVVPVGEASVVIAVSAERRANAIRACEFGIEELKRTVPIWKKEVYEDGSVWKANVEADLVNM